MSAGSGNQSTRTSNQSAQNTANAGGAAASSTNVSGQSNVNYRYSTDYSNKVGGDIQAAGAAKIELTGKGASYAGPVTSTTTNITGIDPAAAIAALASLSAKQAAAPGGSGTTVVSGSSPDLSGLGAQISQSITSALGGGSGSSTGYAPSSKWLWIGGGVLAVIAIIFFLKRK